MLICSTSCLPPVPLWSAISQNQEVWIEKNENYQKKGYRNKMILLSSSKRLIFSIPLVKGKNKQMSITDVSIAYDEDWILHLSKTLQSSYGSAPYFHFIYHDIMRIFGKKHKFLWNLNTELFAWVLQFMNLTIDLKYTESYIKVYDRSVLDLRNLNTAHLQSQVQKPYAQISNYLINFEPNLSILDLLFCMGPEAKTYL